jgi:hypothetical protein
MINTFEELKYVTQHLYCIVYRGTIDGMARLCYLQRNSKPFFFYSYEQAKIYFDAQKIATQNDSLWFWKTGNLIFPDAKILKVTVSEFESIEE